MRTVAGVALLPLLALATSLASCEPSTPLAVCPAVLCVDCASVANVLVTDASTGLPVAGAAVTGGGAAWTCSEIDGKTLCSSIQTSGAAPFAAQVTAPGHAEATAQLATVAQERDRCCGACVVYVPASVQLVPL